MEFFLYHETIAKEMDNNGRSWSGRMSVGRHRTGGSRIGCSCCTKREDGAGCAEGDRSGKAGVSESFGNWFGDSGGEGNPECPAGMAGKTGSCPVSGCFAPVGKR